MTYKTLKNHTKLRFAFTVGMSMVMLLVQLSAGIPFGVQDAHAVISYEQEGFRFRDDDGSETTATWLEPQDTNIIRGRNINTRLRMLVDTTDDTPSNQYQLEYKKSTDGTYKRVIKNITTPEIETSSSNAYGGGATSFTLSHSVNSGQQLAVLVTAMRLAEGDFTLSATYNGDAMVSAGRETATTTNRRYVSEIFYLTNPDVGIADVVVTSSQANARAVVSAHSLIGFLGTIGGTGSNTNGCTASVNTVQANSLVLTASTERSNNTPPTMDPDGSNVELYELDTGAANTEVVGGGYSLPTTSTGSYTGGSTCSATQGDIAFAAEFRFDTTQQPIYLSPSANISASGANTTAQLTSPSGKNTGDFVTGRIQDDENPADAIDITTDDYTELEWSLIATAVAADGDVYQFRVTILGTPLDTYSLTPEWTIPPPVLTQNDWRIYLNNNVIDPTDPWPNGAFDLGENAYLDSGLRANDPLETADVVRLRMSIQVTETDLETGARGFILAYAEATDCTTVSSWTDIDDQNGSGTWRFFDSPVTDGSTITTNRLGVSDVSGRVSESDPTSTNPSTVSAGQDLEWDWVVQYNGVQQAKSYCFRIERDDGDPLDAYNSDSYPKIDIAPGVNDLMRHGNFYSTGVEKGMYWTGTSSENTPVFDAQAANSSTSSTVTLSSFTVGNNANRILLCAATAIFSQTVTSITWNGASESFTKIDDLESSGGGRLELWYLLAPTATTSNVVVTYSGGVFPKAAGCVSVYNAEQSAPSGHETYLIDTGSANTVSVNVSTDPGDMVIDIVGKINGDGNLTSGDNQAVQWSIESSGGDQAMSTQIGTNGTTTMSWNSSESVQSMGIIAVPIHPN